MVQDLEDRRLMAVVPINIAGSPIPQYRGPANVGSANAGTSFIVNEVERFDQSGRNDFINDAQVISAFGTTQSGRANAVDVSGNLSSASIGGGNFEPDIDIYAMDLRAGDILDIATYGSAIEFTTFLPNGRIWYGVDGPSGFGTPEDGFLDIYPTTSPLQSITAGGLNANLAQVVPEDGRYYVEVAANVSSGAYTLGLRAYRPSLELSPQGTQQKILLDFDGGTVPLSAFGVSVPGFPGITRIDPFEAVIEDLGIVATQAEVDALIENITQRVRQDFETVKSNVTTGTMTIGSNLGTNGDFASTGIGGQYGVQIFNTRSPEGLALKLSRDPTVTRVVLASTLQSPVAAFGRAQSVDIGNFDPSELVGAVSDSFFTAVEGTPLGGNANLFDATAEVFARTLSHEAGHSFGLLHTSNINDVLGIIDTGGEFNPIANRLGVGPDGLFGTADDIPVEFVVDRFEPTQGNFGIEFVPQALSHVLSVGGVGTSTGGVIRGTVFLDAGAPGVFTGDVGQPGITVFLEADGVSGLSAGDLAVLTDANGVYQIAALRATTRCSSKFPTASSLPPRWPCPSRSEPRV